MTFDSIIPDTLWAVRYDGEEDNAFYQAFDQWSDPIWLRDFFFQNKNDLNKHFKITNIDKAIYETIDNADKLQCLILELVRNHLISEGVVDSEGFIDLLQTQ